MSNISFIIILQATVYNNSNLVAINNIIIIVSSRKRVNTVSQVRLDRLFYFLLNYGQYKIHIKHINETGKVVQKQNLTIYLEDIGQKSGRLRKEGNKKMKSGVVLGRGIRGQAWMMKQNAGTMCLQPNHYQHAFSVQRN